MFSKIPENAYSLWVKKAQFFIMESSGSLISHLAGSQRMRDPPTIPCVLLYKDTKRYIPETPQTIPISMMIVDIPSLPVEPASHRKRKQTYTKTGMSVAQENQLGLPLIVFGSIYQGAMSVPFLATVIC